MTDVIDSLTDRRKFGRAKQAALVSLGIGAWVAIWWGAAVVFEVSPNFLPTPWQVAGKLVWLTNHEIGGGTLWVHIWWSLLRLLCGFLLATAIGVPLGLLIGYFLPVRDFVNPIFDLLRNVPPIAWAPFSLLWFGASFGSQAFVIFVSALPPILMNTQLGVQITDEALISAARMLGARPVSILFQVGLPASAPSVFAGMRIGLANGWLALVGAEIIAGPSAMTGLGFLILVGQQNLQAMLTIGAMVLIGVIGASLDYLVRRIEARVTRNA
jgi:ABC-type nitrate/sulfonate/bicarbonate transport system permease component